MLFSVLWEKHNWAGCLSGRQLRWRKGTTRVGKRSQKTGKWIITYSKDISRDVSARKSSMWSLHHTNCSVCNTKVKPASLIRRKTVREHLDGRVRNSSITMPASMTKFIWFVNLTGLHQSCCLHYMQKIQKWLHKLDCLWRLYAIRISIISLPRR